MKKFLSFVFVALLLTCATGMLTATAWAQGGGGGGRGSVKLKGQSGSHGVKPYGDGHVILDGGYYVAPAVECSVNIYDVDCPDGTQVEVTLEYAPAAHLKHIEVGLITIVGGQGSLSTIGNPTAISNAAPLATMSIRHSNGKVIMSGSIHGL